MFIVPVRCKRSLTPSKNSPIEATLMVLSKSLLKFTRIVGAVLAVIPNSDNLFMAANLSSCLNKVSLMGSFTGISLSKLNSGIRMFKFLSESSIVAAAPKISLDFMLTGIKSFSPTLILLSSLLPLKRISLPKV